MEKTNAPYEDISRPGGFATHVNSDVLIDVITLHSQVSKSHDFRLT